MSSDQEFSDCASTSIHWDDERDVAEEGDLIPDSASTTSSFGSTEQELNLAYDPPFNSSDELDRLSQCLTNSEVWNEKV
ncbi:unnamed protein product, partial [Mesorhabditis belari]|uniref:Uncharacterized protein n=1 Tax=Mesorhabditis belari TaxID=2138241 RepID=A0AAF3ENF9_9BILA